MLVSPRSTLAHASAQYLAIAMKCSTALVEPPVAITRVMAFSNALKVMMSLGFRSFFNKSSMYLQHSRRASLSTCNQTQSKQCEWMRVGRARGACIPQRFWWGGHGVCGQEQAHEKDAPGHWNLPKASSGIPCITSSSASPGTVPFALWIAVGPRAHNRWSHSSTPRTKGLCRSCNCSQHWKALGVAPDASQQWQASHVASHIIFSFSL